MIVNGNAVVVNRVYCGQICTLLVPVKVKLIELPAISPTFHKRLRYELPSKLLRRLGSNGDEYHFQRNTGD